MNAFYTQFEESLKNHNKIIIKHQKGVPSTKNFHNPYIPYLPKFGKNLMDPPGSLRIFKPCAFMTVPSKLSAELNSSRTNKFETFKNVEQNYNFLIDPNYDSFHQSNLELVDLNQGHNYVRLMLISTLFC
jgi:hypothetical protein